MRIIERGGPARAPTGRAQEDSMNERRHAHRYELFIPLQVNAGSANFPQAGTAHLRDISTRGLYFIGENSIPPGTHLEVTFSLPPELITVCRAEPPTSTSSVPPSSS